jgi:hypothetical protein
MAIPNTLEASNVILPKDLVITAQPNIDTNYFTVTAKGLELDSGYNFQFQWVYEDGAVGPWSPSVFLITPTESAPGAPSVTVPGTSTGYIPVTLSTFPTNALRVDVRVTGGDLGTGKLVHSFYSDGTITIPAKAGFYYVELYTVTPTGINGTPTSVFEITVSDIGEVIQSPTNPNGFSALRVLAGVQLSWNGTYANGTFTGFEAIKIYAGTSATATAGTYTEVGVLTGNNVKNTITIPVDGTYVVYGQPTYLHAAAVNKANPPVVGTIQPNVANVPLGPGKATDVDINDGAVVISKLASDVLTVGNLKAGDINATSYIRAGTKAANGLTGARVEISSSTITQTGTNVLPGFYIYNSAGTPVLSAPLGGGLSINGSGTFTGSITGASGQFDGDIGASGGNFTVRSGIVTALSGEIGGWKITSSSIYSSANTAVNRMALYPSTPQLSLIAPSSFKIELDPTVGLKFSKISDNAGSTITSVPFQVSPNGNLTATDATITVTAGIDNVVKIGKGVQGSNNGIYINDNNYWYGTGNFKVGGATNNIVWDNSTSSLTIKGKFETTGNIGVFTGNTLTIDGGAISADQVVQLSAGTALIDGVINLFTDYFTVSSGETEIFGTIKMSGNTTFYNQTRFNSTDNQIVLDGSVGAGSTGVLRNIYINTTLVGLTSTTGRVGDVWLQYA